VGTLPLRLLDILGGVERASMTIFDERKKLINIRSSLSLHVRRKGGAPK